MSYGREGDKCLPFDDRAYSEIELDGLATVTAVEFLAIGERAAVVDTDGIPSCGFARAFDMVCYFDSDLRGQHRGCQKDDKEWKLHLSAIDEVGKEGCCCDEVRFEGVASY